MTERLVEHVSKAFCRESLRQLCVCVCVCVGRGKVVTTCNKHCTSKTCTYIIVRYSRCNSSTKVNNVPCFS